MVLMATKKSKPAQTPTRRELVDRLDGALYSKHLSYGYICKNTLK